VAPHARRHRYASGTPTDNQNLMLHLPLMGWIDTPGN